MNRRPVHIGEGGVYDCPVFRIFGDQETDAMLIAGNPDVNVRFEPGLFDRFLSGSSCNAPLLRAHS